MKHEVLSKDSCCGYLYLLSSGAYKDQNVYKIGRTYDLTRRIKEYPLDSFYIQTKYVINYKEGETQLKKKLCETEDIIHRKDLGIEYFQCNINIIKRIFQEFDDNIPDDVCISPPPLKKRKSTYDDTYVYEPLKKRQVAKNEIIK